MCIVKISKFLGRSGNNWLQLVNALYYAFKVKRCTRVAFPEQPLLSVTEINNSETDCCGCSKTVTDRQNFFFSNHFGVPKIEVGTLRELAQQYLLPHLRDLEIDSGPSTGNELAVHIRSGDTFKPRPHGHYFPPPLDYYRQLMSKYAEVTVVFEDEQNPCIKRLKDEFPDAKFQSSTLVEDLRTLCRAENVAIGYGSFGLLVYLLSRQLKTLYIPSYLEHDTFLYKFNWSDHRLERLVSVDLAKYREKMGQRWQGSPGQISIMLNWGNTELNNNKNPVTVPPTPAKMVRSISRPYRLEDCRVIHYCFDRFPNNYGGVARFDHQLSIAYPQRQFVKSGDKAALLRAIRGSRMPIVVTDNQCVTDVPRNCPAVVVHHGVARATVERNPELARNAFYSDIVKRQDRMLAYRNPDNTLMLSPSQYCLDLFRHYYGDRYANFRHLLLRHASELDPRQYKSSFNETRPVILGNFSNANKGIRVLNKLKKALPEFEIKRLCTQKQPNIGLHNEEITKIYLSADIFLQLGGSEGFGYATLDAFNKGLLVCGTDVGLLYDLKSSDVARVFSHASRDSADEVARHIRDLWASRDIYARRSHEWYLDNSGFDEWCKEILKIITDFANTVY